MNVDKDAIKTTLEQHPYTLVNEHAFRHNSKTDTIQKCANLYPTKHNRLCERGYVSSHNMEKLIKQYAKTIANYAAKLLDSNLEELPFNIIDTKHKTTNIVYHKDPETNALRPKTTNGYRILLRKANNSHGFEIFTLYPATFAQYKSANYTIKAKTEDIPLDISDDIANTPQFLNAFDKPTQEYLIEMGKPENHHLPVRGEQQGSSIIVRAETPAKVGVGEVNLQMTNKGVKWKLSGNVPSTTAEDQKLWAHELEKANPGILQFFETMSEKAFGKSIQLQSLAASYTPKYAELQTPDTPTSEKDNQLEL